MKLNFELAFATAARHRLTLRPSSADQVDLIARTVKAVSLYCPATSLAAKARRSRKLRALLTAAVASSLLLLSLKATLTQNSALLF